ncbi:ArnT family glycosyltransferase [Deferribacter abyssi]|uniref:ArnT family glycosyltransferase n=1 Tax=Deferribacter abyssi TaxID=213806 RepID=UPI003C283E0D
MNKYFIFFFTTIVILFNLLIYIEQKPLIHEEPRRAIIAQEMLLSGNYVVPTVYSRPYVKKPPLQNWLIAILGYKKKYVSNFDARFPSVLALLLIGFSLLIFIMDKKIAVMASIITMTNYLMLYSYGNKSEPDLLLTLFTLLTFFLYIKSPKNFKFILISSFFNGLGILAKGISPLFFYPGIVIYLLLYKRKEFYDYFKFLLIHLLLSLLLPAIWLIMYYFNGDINNLISGFSSQATDRVRGGLGEIITHFSLFAFRIFLAFFPWGFLIMFYKKFSYKIRDDIFNSSLVIFFVSFIIMALLPGGRGRYFMPAVPFFAIIISYLLVDDVKLNPEYKKIITYIFSFIMVVSICFLLYFGFYLQIVIVLSGWLLFLFYARNTKSVIYLLLFFNLFLFTIFTHTYEYYKVKNYYDYKGAAKQIVERLNEELPLVVDVKINPIQLMFNYERMTKEKVYSSAVNRFQKYYFVAGEKITNCEYMFDIDYSKKRFPKLYFYKCQK